MSIRITEIQPAYLLCSGDYLLLPVIILCLKLICTIAVLPAHSAYDGLIIDMQGYTVSVGQLLRQSGLIVTLNLPHVSVTIDYTVELNAIEEEQPLNISLGSE